MAKCLRRGQAPLTKRALVWDRSMDYCGWEMPESQHFTSFDGTSIAYETWGRDDARPWVLLHHGFVADRQLNWVLPGIVDALVGAGRRVVALDARCHGQSEKLSDPARCGEANMSRDVSALIDLLGVQEIDLAGYSMGAVVALLTASRDRRIRRLVTGGVGEGIVVCGGVDQRVMPASELARALMTDDPGTIRNPDAAGMRAFADAIKADRAALATQCQAVHASPIALDAVTAPTLVLAGDCDPLAVNPQALVDAIPGAVLQVVTGDHMAAVGAPAFRDRLVAFLGE